MGILYPDLDGPLGLFMDVTMFLMSVIFLVYVLIETPIAERRIKSRSNNNGDVGSITISSRNIMADDPDCYLKTSLMMVDAVERGSLPHTIYTDPRYGNDTRVSLLLLQISLLLHLAIYSPLESLNYISLPIFIIVVLYIKISMDISTDLKVTIHLLRSGGYHIIYHLISDIILPIVAMMETLIILMHSESYFDLIANSVLVYFVLELDEFILTSHTHEMRGTVIEIYRDGQISKLIGVASCFRRIIIIIAGMSVFILNAPVDVVRAMRGKEVRSIHILTKLVEALNYDENRDIELTDIIND